MAGLRKALGHSRDIAPPVPLWLSDMAGNRGQACCPQSASPIACTAQNRERQPPARTGTAKAGSPATCRWLSSVSPRSRVLVTSARRGESGARSRLKFRDPPTLAWLPHHRAGVPDPFGGQMGALHQPLAIGHRKNARLVIEGKRPSPPRTARASPTSTRPGERSPRVFRRLSSKSRPHQFRKIR